jgi:deferrochelatase/peroxidase EfeB
MPSDPFFRDGAARSARGLKDDVDASDGTPIGWKFGATPETTPDVLIVLGADTEDRLSTEAAALISDLGDSVDIVCREEGSRLDKDTEHFGFVDGISQPGVRGLIGVDQPLTRRSFPESDPRSTLYSRPGQPLVWPGQFLFGYHTQRADDHAPGPPSEADNAFLRNGSLLVYRRLRQDVGAFREGMRVLVQKFAAKGVVIDEDKAAAWSVGRWPDGTPVSLSPDGPNAKISESSVLRNGFLFDAAIGPASLVEESGPISFPGAADDKLGSNCPFFAHIRKVNPRDHVVDQGSSGITLRSQMLRRGIPSALARKRGRGG